MEEVDSIVMPYFIYKVVDLNGTFRKKFDSETDAEYRKNLWLHQREIMVIFNNGRPAVYSYWVEDPSGDEKLGPFIGKFSLSHNPPLGLRRWKHVHDFREIEAAVPIPASPHIYTAGSNKVIAMWDHTINLIDPQGQPLKPEFLDSIQIDQNISDMLYVEENGLLYSAHTVEPNVLNNQNQIVNEPKDLALAHRVCTIANCAFCQVDGELCTGCRAGYALESSKTKCSKCSDPNTSPQLCQNRRPWDIVQKSPTAPNMKRVL